MFVIIFDLLIFFDLTIIRYISLTLFNWLLNMQLIVISGPSGSGKTTLSKSILKILKNGIILNTDNYSYNNIINDNTASNDTVISYIY